MAQYHGEKCFFKIIDEEFFIKELNGYLISYKEIPIMRMMFVKRLFNSNKYLLTYKYDNVVEKNNGLLNDLLVHNDLLKKINRTEKKYLNKLLTTYKHIYNGEKRMLNYCPSNIFFIERIDTRLRPWYKDLIESNLKIIIGGKKYNISKIIKETIKYFNDNKNTNYECVLSQGDPNTLNISKNSIFFDLATAGYNPIIGELSITFISTLLYDNYFCPKYHKASYYLHEDAIKNVEFFKPCINIKKIKKEIKIDSDIKTSNIRKFYMKSYIKILKKAKINMTSDIKYYLVMRLLCVFNINDMSLEDYYYSLYMVCYLYDKFSNNKNVYAILYDIIDEMEVVKGEK